MTAGDALRASAIDPREARLLLAAATGFSEASVLAHPEKNLPQDVEAVFREHVARRARGEPVAYILGRKEFYGLEGFRVLAREAPTHLLPGGWLLVEHGAGQHPAVCALFEAAGLETTASWPDLAGIPRVSGGKAVK